jgi:hypothetical protein
MRNKQTQVIQPCEVKDDDDDGLTKMATELKLKGRKHVGRSRKWWMDEVTMGVDRSDKTQTGVMNLRLWKATHEE